MVSNWDGYCDRRKSARISKHFPVTVLEAALSSEGARSSSGENLYIGKAIASRAFGTNISKGGLALDTRKPYRLDTVLAFEVTLPEPKDCLIPLIRRFVQRRAKGFRALCQVMWVSAVSANSYRIGVRFIDVDENRSVVLDQLETECRWQERLMDCTGGYGNRFTERRDDSDDM
jgi:hypothetical protein